MIDLDKASTFDKDTVIRHLMFNLTQDQRRDLMREYPAAYNRLMGRDIVAVVYGTDDERRGEPVPS